MVARNPAYPSSTASFVSKVDHIDPVLAEDVNELQREVVASQTFSGVIGELPPSGSNTGLTIGVLPPSSGGAAVDQRITAHLDMLNRWIADFKNGNGGFATKEDIRLLNIKITAVEAKANKAITDAATAKNAAATALAKTVSNAAEIALQTQRIDFLAAIVSRLAVTDHVEYQKVNVTYPVPPQSTTHKNIVFPRFRPPIVNGVRITHKTHYAVGTVMYSRHRDCRLATCFIDDTDKVRIILEMPGRTHYPHGGNVAGNLALNLQYFVR